MIRTPLFLLFFCVITIGGASAEGGIFEILNETFYDGDWSVADEHGTPEKNWKTNGHISAWIDITGFENMGVIDNVSYVNGSPKDFAIVERDAEYSVDGTMTRFKSTCKIANCTTTNTTTATQTTVLEWKVKHCGLTGCYYTYHSSTLIISCTVDSPRTYDNNIPNFAVKVKAYNNSVTPYTLIYVPYRENIIKSEVTYKNNVTSWHDRIGWVTTNDRGTEHIQFLNKSFLIADDENMITRRASYFVINEAPLDWSKLDVTVYTPYVKFTDFGGNVTVVHSKPSDYVVWKVLITFMAVILLFIACMYRMLRR